MAKRSNFRLLYVNHRDAIAHPSVTAAQIQQFLGGDLIVSRMAAVVDPSLYRQRRSTA